MEVDTICAQHAVAVPWHAQKVIVRSDLAGEPQDSGWTRTCFLPTNVANGHEELRSVPSGSTMSNRVKTRPRMCFIRVTGGKELTIMSIAVFYTHNFPDQTQGRQSMVFYT